MDEIVFTKLTAAGNDFVLIDREQNDGLILIPEIIRSICDRRYGIGADGVLTISDCESSDFKMEYFNADGSNGMLCGNGARSIIKYAEHSGRLKKSTTQFSFQDELFSGEILEQEKVKFNLNEPTKLKLNFEIQILNKTLIVSFIDTGAHHVVIDVDKIGNNFEPLKLFPVEQFGKAIRDSKYFEPIGTNVNFISIKDEIIKIRTYERGVESETLACGTGSVASSMISYLNGKVKPPVKLITRSGEKLVVDFEFSDSQFGNVSLTGPAKIVFEGKYKIKRK